MTAPMSSFVCISVFVFFCLAPRGTVTAMENDKIGSAGIAKLRAMVNEIAASNGAVGTQVSVIVGDQRADFIYGTANAELNIPMTVDTITQIGSTTKVINAAMVMTLVDEGKLALDTPVIKYIAELKLADKQVQETVTLRQLLSMSSGIDMGPNKGFMGDNALGRYIATLSDIPQTYPQGRGFGYSNANVCIAGYAAEQVTGLPWDTLLKKRIFEPTGIAHAVNLPEELPYQRVAVGHTPTQNGQPTKVTHPWITSESLGPAGLTLAMSAHDLASFGRLFINDGKAGNGNRVLSEAAVKAMMTPTNYLPIAAPLWGVGDIWGLGPTMAKWGDTVVWGHGGSNLGGSSQLLWFPEKHAVLAFTVNTPSVFEPFSVGMTGEFTQALFEVRAPKLTAPTPPPRVDNPQRLVGNYVRYGVRYEITEQTGRLRYKEFNEELIARYKEMNQKLNAVRAAALVDEDLIPLGNDRFQVKFPGFTNAIPLFFFGKDAQGRATNITSGLRTGYRVE